MVYIIQLNGNKLELWKNLEFILCWVWCGWVVHSEPYTPKQNEHQTQH